MIVSLNYDDEKFYELEFIEDKFIFLDLKSYESVNDILEDFYSYLKEIKINKLDSKKITVNCYEIIGEVENGDIKMLNKLFDMRYFDYEAERKMFSLFHYFKDYKHIHDTYKDIDKVELEYDNFIQGKEVFEIIDAEHGYYLFQIK